MKEKKKKKRFIPYQNSSHLLIFVGNFMGFEIDIRDFVDFIFDVVSEKDDFAVFLTVFLRSRLINYYGISHVGV